MKIDIKMEDFAEKICAAVVEKLGEGYHTEVREVKKNNGILLHGLLIMKEGETVAPSIYLEDFLEAYVLGTPFGDIVRWLLSVYEKSRVEGSVDMGFFRTYGKVEEGIFYGLVGKEGNEKMLEEVPHVDFLDLAICFYYACRNEELGDGSILIHNSHMEMWGVGTGDLYRAAQANTPKIFPWECRGMDEVLGDAVELFGGDIPVQEDDMGEVQMKILSNRKRSRGASSILYPGVLEGIAAVDGHSLFILPSSIHEVVLLPDNGKASPDELKKMIFEINRTQVAPEDVLSDSLYYYDAGKKEIIIIE